MLWNRAAGSFASDFMIAAAMCGGAFGAKSVTGGGSSSMCFANSSPTPSALNAGALALLGRHVERCSHQRSGAGLDRAGPVRRRKDLRHAEVEDLHLQRAV